MSGTGNLSFSILVTAFSVNIRLTKCAATYFFQVEFPPQDTVELSIRATHVKSPHPPGNISGVKYKRKEMSASMKVDER